MSNLSIDYIKGVGPVLARKFAVLGVYTVEELKDYLPKRYDDYSEVQKIGSLTPGTVTLLVTINNVIGRYVRRGMHITEALASDETGSVRLVWFNQPYRAGAIIADKKYYLTGEFGLHAKRMSITSPAIEPADGMLLHTARIVPIYKETKGLTSIVIRKAIHAAFVKPLGGYQRDDQHFGPGAGDAGQHHRAANCRPASTRGLPE